MIIDHKTFDLGGKMVFERAVIRTPFSKPNPMSDEACFLFVRQGYGETYSENQSAVVERHESILMKCGSYLNKMMSRENDGIYEAIAVHFYPDVLEKVYNGRFPEYLKNSGSKTPDKPAIKLNTDELFTKFFEGIFFYFSHPELVNDELIILKLKELLLLLENTNESDKLHQILSSLFTPQQYSFRAIIDAHIFDPLSVEELSVICGKSLSGFKRTFKEVFGISPARYIREQRLQKAAEILVSSIKKPVSEVAYECAFNDVATFSNCFRKHFGCAPSEYRVKGD